MVNLKWIVLKLIIRTKSCIIQYPEWYSVSCVSQEVKSNDETSTVNAGYRNR